MLTEQLNNIPKTSGCYIFKDKKGQVIYVGKSKFLPKRVRSYFTKKHMDLKTIMLVDQIREVEFISTPDEDQSLILESDLIRMYNPKFNMKGKDDRSRRWYIVLTEDDFPRLDIYNERNLVGNPLFEFTNSNLCYEVFELLHNIFELRTCSYDLSPSNILESKFKPCLEYHIGNCGGPCIGGIHKFVYSSIIDNVRRVSNFEFDHIDNSLNKLMSKYSRELEFEKANSVKHKLVYLSSLREKLEVLRIKRFIGLSNQFKLDLNLVNTPLVIDSFDNSHTSGDCQVSSLVRYTNGVKDKSNYRKFNIRSTDKPDDYQSFDEVINRRFKRLLDEKQQLPSLVIIDGGKGQLNVVKSVFESLGLIGKVDLISISKDDKHNPVTIHTIDGGLHSIGNDTFGKFLCEVQNEVHRFVINFHRDKKVKKLFS